MALLGAPIRYVVAFLTGPAATARALSGAGVLIPVFAPGTGPGAGRIDFPFGVTPEVFLLE